MGEVQASDRSDSSGVSEDLGSSNLLEQPAMLRRSSSSFSRNYTFVSAEDEEAGKKIKVHCMREYRRAQRWHRTQHPSAVRPDVHIALFPPPGESPTRRLTLRPDGTKSLRRFSQDGRASKGVFQSPQQDRQEETVAVRKSLDENLLLLQDQSHHDAGISGKSKGNEYEPCRSAQSGCVSLSAAKGWRLPRTTLDQSNVDPLSSFPIPLFEEDGPLVNHLYKYYLPLIFSNSTDVTYHCFPPFNGLYFRSAPYFHTMLAQASCQAAALQGEAVPTKLSTYHMWKAVQITNQGLRDPARQTSDEVLLGVLGLIKFEAQCGNKNALSGHFDGLNKIFAKRDVNEVYQTDRQIQPLEQMLSWIMVGTSSPDGTFPVPRIDAAAKARFAEDSEFLLQFLNKIWQDRPRSKRSGFRPSIYSEDSSQSFKFDTDECISSYPTPPSSAPDLRPENLKSRYVTQICSLLFTGIAHQEYALFNPLWKSFTSTPVVQGSSIDKVLWGAARGHVDLPEYAVAMMRRMPAMIRCLRAVGQLNLETRFRVREFLLWGLMSLGPPWTENDLAILREEIRAKR